MQLVVYGELNSLLGSLQESSSALGPKAVDKRLQRKNLYLSVKVLLSNSRMNPIFMLRKYKIYDRLTAITQLVHHGMIFVPIGYTFGAGMFEMEQVKGGSPYGYWCRNLCW